MSFGSANTATDDPAAMGLTAEATSSNEQGIPVPWLSGQKWCPAHWIIPEVLDTYKSEKKKHGATTRISYWGTVAAVFCTGLVDACLAVEIGGAEDAWTGGTITRVAGQDFVEITLTRKRTRKNLPPKMRLYWGTATQPRDAALLRDSADHPAYRHQCYAVFENMWMGDNINTVPNIRLRLYRAPRPVTVNATPKFLSGDVTIHDKALRQGEPMPLAILELMDNPRFGAGLPATAFDGPAIQTLANSVFGGKTVNNVATELEIGGHSPSLDRAVPLRDFIKEQLSTFDGWARISNGKITLGRTPHAGSTESLASQNFPVITLDDLVKAPRITTTPPATGVNIVTVTHRDSAQKLIDTSSTATASDALNARRIAEPVKLDMPAIIDKQQAATFAARVAAEAAAGTIEGTLQVRRARARQTNGQPLRPGDIARFIYTPLGLNLFIRVTKRTDPYKGSVTLGFQSERGLYAKLPDISADTPVVVSPQVPDPITSARILVAPGSTNDLVSLYVLAKRPLSRAEADANRIGQSVSGYQIHLADNAAATAFTQIEDSTGWACQGILAAAIGADDTTLTVTFDQDNLDLDDYSAATPIEQASDTLLLIIDSEIISLRDLDIPAGSNWQRAFANALRGRRKSKAAAHAVGTVAWLVYAADLTEVSNPTFVPPPQTEKFKLLPYTSYATLDKADAPLTTVQIPVIPPPPPATPHTLTLQNLPDYATERDAVTITGSVIAPDSDLANVTIDLVQLDADGNPGPSLLLFASPPRADQRGQFDFAYTVTVPAQGDWIARLFSVNDNGVTLSVTSNTCHVGPPSNGYTGDDFLPAFNNGYTWTYSRQIGRWDSRSGWLRLHIHLAVLTRTNPNNTGSNTIALLDLTTAGIPQSAWPANGMDHGYWGIQRSLRVTGTDTDMFQPLLYRDGESLKVIMQHFNSDVDESGMTAGKIGNHSDGATVLDLSWVIPDPIQSTMPAFDPAPDLQQANLSIKGTGTVASIQVYIRARTLTVKAPEGQTLAGCRLLVQSLSKASNTSATTRINRTFTAADGAVANVELSWYHQPWTYNATYKTAIQAQLFSPTGQFVTYTGNTYSFKNTGKTPS